FVSERLRYVDAAHKPSAPLLAGLAATAVAAPVVWLLPIVGTGTALAFGAAVGLGTRAGAKETELAERQRPVTETGGVRGAGAALPFVPHSDRLLTRLENGGPCRVVRPPVEADRIAHTDHAADHDRPEHAAVPVRLHGIPQSGQRLVHAFARP